MSVETEANVALARVKLLNGENPIEVQRQIRHAKLQRCLTQHMEQAVKAGREAILRKLLCEEHKWCSAVNASAKMQVR